MNKPVSFELAKLLKEKGIKIESSQDNEIYGDCYCKYYKGSDYILVSHYTLNFTQDSQRYDFVNHPVYDAPTITDVVMWLYEKHGIWVSVDWMKRIKPYNSGFYCHLRGTNKSLNRDNFIVINDTLNPGYEVFNSPTEAYEAAIEYILNNLI